MYLGLDLGTSGLKALLMDGDQRVIGTATAPLAVSRPHPGWSEQDPAAWISALEQTLDTLARDHRSALAAVRGIGLSGQMHGATLLDAADRVLRPCILWNDTRSAAQAARLDSDPRFRRISGNIVFPGFTAPKLVWVAEQAPDLFARIAKVLLPKDYLRLWLTGEHVSDMSDAAGTSWLDTGARDWSDDLLEATGLGRDQMPRLVEGTEVSGKLRGALADRWGMGGSVVVAGGGGDNAVSAVGAGTIAPGSAFVSLGTSGVLFAAIERYLPAPESAVHAFCHALPGLWHQMGVILSASSALDWFARISRSTAAELLAEFGEGPQAPGGVTFLPYLSGERTPHNDADIRGAFVGLAHEDDRAALTRAVLDGVAFALRDNLEALRAAGTDISRVTAVGGGSRAHRWIEAIANALDLSVDLPAKGESGAAFGAARLGLIAATGADPRTVCTPPPIECTIEPARALRGAYEDAYRRYRALYPALAAVR
ncbi:xylulokinase [Breoghania sp. L-A4]|uniref:xylulokinase n=1 Tax=Breoghania sp. L-A4 TaxID=2304600 RepID=UPI000E360AE9|nr:xylulokinase [Breoghania sp. L-A4]AXS42206.1 xylulokinase [Breoghania sp. L-A4]